jgi:sterol desaturase/sphingolipid hydroxylase (fatty acid hydroxylase superfamily)
MSHWKIDKSETPIRLFKSDFLEFFTHISPITVTVIWLPFAVFFFVRGIVQTPAGGSPLYVLAGFLIGLFLWTLAEYLLHRFVFHFRPRNAWQEKVTFLFHGIHHVQPQCKTRLVMPPVVSIPLAAIFYGLFSLICGNLLGAGYWVNPLVSGFTIGYLSYDLIHYATHHVASRTRWGKYLKRYHMLHHFKTPDLRYGVSSPIWDFVFNTHPAD